MNTKRLLESLWSDYIGINPQALSIHKLLKQAGEPIVNDHIAIRTFRHAKTGINIIASPFTSLGYHGEAEYEFPEKKLYARFYKHPNPKLPKIFISELKIDTCSTFLQQTVNALIDQLGNTLAIPADFVFNGIPWKPIPYKTYQTLKQESEYAAWLSAFGFRANHFTILVNTLKHFRSLHQLNEYLKQHGFKLNSAGGEIKGSKEVYLEQSSTLAAPVPVSFADTNAVIPGCYYEFAYRYKLPDGRLYDGFVAKSADKIFESTDSKAK